MFLGSVTKIKEKNKLFIFTLKYLKFNSIISLEKTHGFVKSIRIPF